MNSSRSITGFRAGVLAILGAGLLWSFWPTILDLVNRWSHNPTYSHGYLVPAFAAFLLWRRRAMLATVPSRWSWLGAGFLALGAVPQLVGAWFYVDVMGGLALILGVTGVLTLLGGREMLRWAWPGCAFLCFMLPLPFSLEIALGQPLQRMATLAGTYCLQTIGFPALSEGNVIIVNDLRIGVVEACSGLSMLMVFFALSTALALVISRPWWERLLLVVSAIPIAIIANVARITLTSVAYEVAGKSVSDVIFHDLAGWLMMPLALLILLAELSLLSRLFIEDDSQRLLHPAAQFATGAVPPKPSSRRKRRSR